MTEYGARLSNCGVVYMKSSSLEAVNAWITEYSTVAPLELVTRECVSDINGRWQ